MKKAMLFLMVTVISFTPSLATLQPVTFRDLVDNDIISDGSSQTPVFPGPPGPQDDLIGVSKPFLTPDRSTLFPEGRMGFLEDGMIQSWDHYETVDICSSATVEMTGGTADTLYSHDQSTVNMSGGNVGTLYAFSDSTVNISGGQVHRLTGIDSSHVNIYGYGFQYDPMGAGPIMYGFTFDRDVPKDWMYHGLLRGFREDGSLFQIVMNNSLYSRYSGELTYDHVVLHTVPEPATVLLLGFGCLALRSRMSKRSISRIL